MANLNEVVTILSRLKAWCLLFYFARVRRRRIYITYIVKNDETLLDNLTFFPVNLNYMPICCYENSNNVITQESSDDFEEDFKLEDENEDFEEDFELEEENEFE